MNKQLIYFYSGAGSDNEGRGFHQVLAKDNQWWERCHTHIQWVYPLPEPSLYNATAPLLDEETITVFLRNTRIQENIKLAWQRAERFLWGSLAQPAWIRPVDHNHLRITRILRFLSLVGFQSEAIITHTRLLETLEFFPEVIIPQKTLDFWRDAVGIIEVL